MKSSPKAILFTFDSWIFQIEFDRFYTQELFDENVWISLKLLELVVPQLIRISFESFVLWQFLAASRQDI